MPKTQIVCTLGPSSEDARVLRNMIDAGMSVARLNCSHGTRSGRRTRLAAIRALNVKRRPRVKVLLDLQGYRIRVGGLGRKKSVELKARQTVFLTNRTGLEGENVIPFDYAGPLDEIKPGNFIYIDDGSIALEIKGSTRNRIRAEVAVPGVLRPKKGVNIPDVDLSFEGLTEKDKKDLRFAVEHKVDFIAQSFVRDKDDILSVRDFIGDGKRRIKLVAKIENRQGIANLDEILDVSEGIMIARGDMGVSLPIYQIPVLQKMIIRKCLERKRFVITATQMLESMTEHLRPTRAEVSDVANAVIDGSDYLMLSGETAVGKHPVEAVRMMKQVIDFTERYEGRRESCVPQERP
jgi:pyruvate kinase